MSSAYAQTIVRDVDIPRQGVAQNAWAVPDAHAVGGAVRDIQVIEVDSSDAGVLQKKLYRGSPPDSRVETTTAIQVTPLGNCRSAEICRDDEGGAEKDATAVSHILEQAILDAV